MSETHVEEPELLRLELDRARVALEQCQVESEARREDAIRYRKALKEISDKARKFVIGSGDERFHEGLRSQARIADTVLEFAGESAPVRDASCLDSGCEGDEHKPHCDHAQSVEDTK